MPTSVPVAALDVRRPADQRLAVPEPDRLAVPLRDIWPEVRRAVAVFLELSADVDLRDQRLRRVAHVENEIGRHDEVDPAAAVLREPAHEALGPAVRARPLRRVAAGVVVHLLHEALLIFRREQ
jgi:hypothetical protein